jgi:hypothetical protein
MEKLVEWNLSQYFGLAKKTDSSIRTFCKYDIKSKIDEHWLSTYSRRARKYLGHHSRIISNHANILSVSSLSSGDSSDNGEYSQLVPCSGEMSI